jgi:toxin ParE1/3/4
MPRIIVSPLAQADIDETWDYIARQHPERRSRRRSDRAAFRMLAANPRLGVARDELRPGLRRFGYARYLIYDRLIRGGIEVVRVVHGARDQEALWRR